VLARIPSGDATVVNHAVEAAQAGFERWRTASGPQRAEILHQAANLLARRRQDLATLVALEVGKPIGEALQEVDRGVVILRYFAEEAVHPVGMVIPAQQAYSPEYSTLSSERVASRFSAREPCEHSGHNLYRLQ